MSLHGFRAGRAVSKHPNGGSVVSLKNIGVRGLPEARFLFR
jgi:hypothetical protein